MYDKNKQQKILNYILNVREPFNIINDKESERLAKYLIERSLNEEMREVTLITTANSQIITKQFKALFGNYSLMDQELKDQINDELVEVKIKNILKNNKIEGEKTFSQLIQGNREKINKVISNHKRDERVSRNGIREIFRLVDVDISEAYLDYMMCKIHEPATKEATSYSEVFNMFKETEYKNSQSKNEKKSNTAAKKASQEEGFYSDHFEEEE